MEFQFNGRDHAPIDQGGLASRIRISCPFTSFLVFFVGVDWYFCSLFRFAPIRCLHVVIISVIRRNALLWSKLLLDI